MAATNGYLVNLPLGGAIVLIVFLCLPQIRQLDPDRFKDRTKLQVFLDFDPFGTVLFVGSVICLLLALTWGGQQYAWSDGRVIALFVCFGVSAIAWVAVQYLQGDSATLSGKVISQRTVACVSVYMFLSSGAFGVIVYYLPTW